MRTALLVGFVLAFGVAIRRGLGIGLAGDRRLLYLRLGQMPLLLLDDRPGALVELKRRREDPGGVAGRGAAGGAEADGRNLRQPDSTRSAAAGDLRDRLAAPAAEAGGRVAQRLLDPFPKGAV